MSLQQLCRQCQRRSSFEYSDGLVCCRSCGWIDEAATRSKNLVNMDGNGAAIFGDDQDGYKERELDEANRRYMDHADSLIESWLTDRKIIAPWADGRSLVSLAQRKFREMRRLEAQERAKDRAEAAAKREAELDPGNGPPTRKRVHLNHNDEARKFPYLIAIAIRLAVLDSKLNIVYNKIESRGEKPETRPANLRKCGGDGQVPVPSLNDIMTRAPPAENGVKPIDSKVYLSTLHRRYVKLLKAPTSPFDTIMCSALDAINRIKHLASLSREELSEASHMPVPKPKKWKPLQWENLERMGYMDESDWDEVLRAAYNLYRAQQVVCLWDSRTSISIAVALVICAIDAVLGFPVDKFTYLMMDICNHLIPGTSQNGAGERFNEMKRFLIGWSTSIVDAQLDIRIVDEVAEMAAREKRMEAGVQEAADPPIMKSVRFPQLRHPLDKKVGNGFRHWGSDHRRGIPQHEMSALAGSVMYLNWRKVYQTRLRTRDGPIPLDEEMRIAKITFASYARNPESRSRAAKGKQSCQSTPADEPQEVPIGIIETSSAFDSYQTARDPISPSGPRHAYAVNRFSPFDVDRLLAAFSDASSDYGDYQGSDDGYQCSVSNGSALRAWNAGLQLSGVAAEEHGVLSSGFTVGNRFEVQAHEAYENNLLTRHGSPPFVSGTVSPTMTIGRSASVLSTGQSEAFGSASEAERAMTDSARPVLDIPYDQELPPSSASRLPRAISMSRTSSPSARSDMSVSTLYSLGSAPSAPCRRQAYKLGPTSEKSRHVGVLLRERDEYVSYRMSVEQNKGLLVSKDVEAAMKTWADEQRAADNFPAVVDNEYLRRIGADWRDLGPFIRDNIHRWSVTESLLRAGVDPMHFPQHCIPQSTTKVYLDLYHYNTEAYDLIASEEMPFDEQDRELHLLFYAEKGNPDDDVLDPVKHAKEIERKKNAYIHQGLWTEIEGAFLKKRKAARPRPAKSTHSRMRLALDAKGDPDEADPEYQRIMAQIEVESDSDDGWEVGGPASKKRKTGLCEIEWTCGEKEERAKRARTDSRIDTSEEEGSFADDASEDSDDSDGSEDPGSAMRAVEAAQRAGFGKDFTGLLPGSVRGLIEGFEEDEEDEDDDDEDDEDEDEHEEGTGKGKGKGRRRTKGTKGTGKGTARGKRKGAQSSVGSVCSTPFDSPATWLDEDIDMAEEPLRSVDAGDPSDMWVPAYASTPSNWAATPGGRSTTAKSPSKPKAKKSVTAEEIPAKAEKACLAQEAQLAKEAKKQQSAEMKAQREKEKAEKAEGMAQKAADAAAKKAETEAKKAEKEAKKAEKEAKKAEKEREKARKATQAQELAGFVAAAKARQAAERATSGGGAGAGFPSSSTTIASYSAAEGQT